MKCNLEFNVRIPGHKRASMPTAAESIAAWIAAGDVEAELDIRDADADVLPPLPHALLRLRCDGCRVLVALPPLPATLQHLACFGCPALTHLPPLPATLASFGCYACIKLTDLPPLPAALETLVCAMRPMTLPDACPPNLRILGAEVGASREYWRKRVAEQHVADRRRVAASLPPLALLFV